MTAKYILEYLNMSEIFMLPVVYHWDNYVEMHFRHNAVPSHFALLFHMQLYNNFLGQCMGEKLGR